METMDIILIIPPIIASGFLFYIIWDSNRENNRRLKQLMREEQRRLFFELIERNNARAHDEENRANTSRIEMHLEPGDRVREVRTHVNISRRSPSQPNSIDHRVEVITERGRRMESNAESGVIEETPVDEIINGSDERRSRWDSLEV